MSRSKPYKVRSHKNPLLTKGNGYSHHVRDALRDHFTAIEENKKLESTLVVRKMTEEEKRKYQVSL